MKIFLISDNADTQTGMRLVGVESEILHTRDELMPALDRVLQDSEIGILIITEKIAKLCPERFKEIKLLHRLPLVVEIPDRHGTERAAESITAYVRDAIGVKI